MATDTLEFKLVMRPAKMNFAVADAHRDNRKRFVVHADEKLTRSQPCCWQNSKRRIGNDVERLQRVPQPCCLKKRARASISSARALLCENWAILLSKTAHGPSLLITKRMVKQNPEKFKAFVAAR